MSTSDAAKREHSGGGGGGSGGGVGTRTERRGTTPPTSREQDNGTLDAESEWENHLGDETRTDWKSGQPAITQEETHKPVISGEKGREKEEDAFCCLDPKICAQKADKKTFPSSVSFRLSKKELDVERSVTSEPEPSLNSSTGLQRAEKSQARRPQVNTRTLPASASVETACNYLLFEKTAFPGEGREEENIATLSCNTPDTTTDSHGTQSVLNGQSGTHVKTSICTVRHGPLPRAVSEAAVSDRDIDDRTRLKNQSQPATEVHYPSSAAMLSSTMVSVLSPHWGGQLRWNNTRDATRYLDAERNEKIQECNNNNSVEKNELHGHLRTRLMDTRRNTVGLSPDSGSPQPALGLRGNLPKFASLDVNCGRLDNRKSDESVFNPRTLSPLSPNLQEKNSTLLRGHDEPSKPTTSSILLSTRRLNAKNSNTNLAPLSLTSSTGNQSGKTFMAGLTQSSVSNSVQDQPLLSPAVSYRTQEISAMLFPSSPQQREGGLSKTSPFSQPPLNKDKADTLFCQQPQAAMKSEPHLTFSRQTLRSTDLGGGSACESQSQLPNSSALSSAHLPHDLLKKQLAPRRTTLLSSWKQTTQVENSPRSPSDTANIVNTPSMNVIMRATDVGTQRRIHADESHSHELGQMLKSHCHTSIRDKEAQTLYGLTTALSPSKFSTATAITTSTQSLSNVSSTNTLTQHSQLDNDYCVSGTGSTATSPHTRDSQTFARDTFFTDATNSLKCQTYSAKNVQPNTNTSPPFSRTPVSPQTRRFASSLNGCSPESVPCKFTNRVSPSPLGFERTYTSMPKPFHAKVVSSLIQPPSPTTTSTTGCHVGIRSPSPTSLLTPPVTHLPSTTSCLLTPPATPILSTPNGASDSSRRQRKGDAKKARRVTWEDSMDLQQPEANTLKSDSPPVASSTLSPSPVLTHTGNTSIFSFLQTHSPTTDVLSPSKTLVEERWERPRSLTTDLSDHVCREERRTQTSPNDTSLTFDRKGKDSTLTRRERTVSIDADASASSRPCAPLSLPPDFSSGYKLRYSSTPYSTLISSRLSQGEAKNAKPSPTIFQETHSPSKSTCTSHLPVQTDKVTDSTALTSKLPPSPVSPLQAESQPSHNKGRLCGSAQYGDSDTDTVNNNPCIQELKNGQMILVDNRIHVSSDTLPPQGRKASSSLSTCVTETLVYRISKPESTVFQESTEPLKQHASKKQISEDSHTSETKKDPENALNLPSERPGDECNKSMKEMASDKSKCVTVSNDQNLKKSRFSLKRGGSTSNPNSSSNKELPLDKAKGETEKANKPGNKMDLVLNKLKQTFKRSEDELSFPWRLKRASQTPSVSGSSDVSDSSDVAVDRNRRLHSQEKASSDQIYENQKEFVDRRGPERFTLQLRPGVGNMSSGREISSWLDESSKQNKLCDAPAVTSDGETPAVVKSQSETKKQVDADKPKLHRLSLPDQNPCMSPSDAAACPTQLKKSASSPRSPFSPFSSLSPISPFPSTDMGDDVFYSPKLQRRRESSSSCEAREGISLVDQRRSRTSTGPPSGSPGHDSKPSESESSQSSYADLKYGIEPGRSFSVSSVLSSRPSGPGRISTGTRFMSVGDLSKSALTCGSYDNDLDQWSIKNDCPTMSLLQPPDGDASKARSRSLPRSLAKCFASWTAEADAALTLPVAVTTTGHQQRPDLDTCHPAWDSECPPTPPPTPPLSPVSRPMSRGASLSSPTPPSSLETAQDSQSTRGHLPSKGYVSSLSTFDESSDSNSDTTTDDEYYLEEDEGDGKETEL